MCDDTSRVSSFPVGVPVSVRKLQNVDEFKRWWSQGKTYQWIMDEYLRRYDIEITPSAIGNWRARLGLERRQERDVSLIPWLVKPEHRYLHVLAMLRAEGRSRTGAPLSDLQRARLASWLRWMREEDHVVDYDPDSAGGFRYVPRRPGVDTDLIRVPDKVTRERGKRE